MHKIRAARRATRSRRILTAAFAGLPLDPRARARATLNPMARPGRRLAVPSRSSPSREASAPDVALADAALAEWVAAIRAAPETPCARSRSGEIEGELPGALQLGIPGQSSLRCARPPSTTTRGLSRSSRQHDGSAVCADLGISARKAHNLRRQLTLPEEIRTRVAERPAREQLSATMAHMSRSTVSPPLERGVLSKGHRRASEATTASDTPSAPGACRPVLLGVRTAPKKRVANVCARRPPRDQPALKPFGGALRC